MASATRAIATAAAEAAGDEGFVPLPDGTELPYCRRESPVDVIVGHGLGADPPQKSWRNDISFDILDGALSRLASSEDRHLSSERKGGAGGGGGGGGARAVFYTARGHGTSRGWESRASKEGGTGMFHWDNLAGDMLDVADRCGLGGRRFVAAGQSMGAATALYMSMAHPDRVAGLVLMRAPRAWETRREAAAGSVLDAEEFRKRKRPGTFHHLPILGAWGTDLPPKDDAERYGRVTCPVLLLSHGDDAAHPIETGETLSRLISHADFVTAEDELTARVAWPEVIAYWLVEKGLVRAHPKC